jgi:hypothetical protein
LRNIIGALVLTLTATAAFAWPKVGDTADYDIVVTQGAQSQAITMNVATITVDPTRDLIVQTTTLSANGRTQSQQQSGKLSDTQNFANAIPTLLAQCASRGGTLENVVTPAGTFNSCKIANNDSNSTGFVWIANVVNGWSKIVTTNTSNGQVTTGTIKAFTAAP